MNKMEDSINDSDYVSCDLDSDLFESITNKDFLRYNKDQCNRNNLLRCLTNEESRKLQEYNKLNVFKEISLKKKLEEDIEMLKSSDITSKNVLLRDKLKEIEELDSIIKQDENTRSILKSECEMISQDLKKVKRDLDNTQKKMTEYLLWHFKTYSTQKKFRFEKVLISYSYSTYPTSSFEEIDHDKIFEMISNGKMNVSYYTSVRNVDVWILELRYTHRINPYDTSFRHVYPVLIKDNDEKPFTYAAPTF
jgi:hypothetical protein